MNNSYYYPQRLGAGGYTKRSYTHREDPDKHELYFYNESDHIALSTTWHIPSASEDHLMIIENAVVHKFSCDAEYIGTYERDKNNHTVENSINDSKYHASKSAKSILREFLLNSNKYGLNENVMRHCQNLYDNIDIPTLSF